MKSGNEGQSRASRGPAWLVSNTLDQQAYHLCSASPHRHLLIFIADADKENGEGQSPPSSRAVIQQIRVSEKVWTLWPLATVSGVLSFICLLYVYLSSMERG